MYKPETGFYFSLFWESSGINIRIPTLLHNPDRSLQQPSRVANYTMRTHRETRRVGGGLAAAKHGETRRASIDGMKERRGREVEARRCIEGGRQEKGWGNEEIERERICIYTISLISRGIEGESYSPLIAVAIRSRLSGRASWAGPLT
jgi:hypothetical protein